jgi:hypothetical protein
VAVSHDTEELHERDERGGAPRPAIQLGQAPSRYP